LAESLLRKVVTAPGVAHLDLGTLSPGKLADVAGKLKAALGQAAQSSLQVSNSPVRLAELYRDRV
jgi:hypothetical protein